MRIDPEVTRQIDHALAAVTSLVEGGIDPFQSRRAEVTLRTLLDAQERLEIAYKLWTGVVKARAKPPRPRMG